MKQKYIKFIGPAVVSLILLSGFSASANNTPSTESSNSDQATNALTALKKSEKLEFTVSVWADNWFALYVNEQLVAEDSVSFTTIRSFNSDTFTFRATYPLNIAMITRDYVENDSGLEYIGSFFGLFPVGDFFTLFQQIGDGGFIAQITETGSGKMVARTSKSWRGLVVHKAPLNSDCEKSRQPLADCRFYVAEEPDGWQSNSFDDSNWVTATEYTPQQIGAKFGYNDIDWDPSAKLIWSEDIRADNTILWRVRFPNRHQ